MKLFGKRRCRWCRTRLYFRRKFCFMCRNMKADW